MNYVGISCGFHDAAISVINSDGEITFAAHSERYSGIKHDPELCIQLVNDARHYYDSEAVELHYYERPLVKYLRRLYAGESPALRTISTGDTIGEVYVNRLTNGNDISIQTHNHHLSHAAGGFQTSPYDRATVVVIDAIGELDTVTIWSAHYDDKDRAQYRRRYTRRYPNSIGLFYSAITKRVGLQPLDEEYILMGMAAYGEPRYVNEMRQLLNDNLHIGVEDNFLEGADNYDIAASAQVLVEELITDVIKLSKTFDTTGNLVYSGGVALNCLANRLLGEYYDNIWIMPNPGDAGSSLGAAALGYGRRVKWDNAYLGHDIAGVYPVMDIIRDLHTRKIVGVASGRAEWGPRALGNRSLLADPRGNEIKDKVNDIKRRQKFRPFAPVILEEHVHDYFDMPSGFNHSRYMQSVARCRHSELFPAIVHHDGTSRVQTVPKDGSGIRQLLEQWYLETGCPMLLNTSLNIRGEPMVNNREDADRFETLYNIRVCS